MNFTNLKDFTYRNIWIIAFIAFVAASLFFMGRYIYNQNRLSKEIIAAKTDTMIQYKTLSGATAYKMYEKTVIDKHMTDSLAKELKIKEKEIQKYIAIMTSSDFSNVKGRGKDTIYINQKGDTVNAKYGEYEDPYISIAATISDSMRFSKLETRDTLSGVFQKTVIGKSIFNKLIVTNKSPYAKITGLENISFKEEKQKSKWGLGIFAGYDPLQKIPTIGFGLSWNLIQFNKK